MYLILGILIVCVPLIVAQWMFVKWTGIFKEPKHHRDDSYVDESLKMNFIEKKVEKTENRK